MPFPAERLEPYERRRSRAVLRAPRGEIPRGYSPDPFGPFEPWRRITDFWCSYLPQYPPKVGHQLVYALLAEFFTVLPHSSPDDPTPPSNNPFGRLAVFGQHRIRGGVLLLWLG